MAENRLQRLSEHGQSVWIDYLSRPLVRDGELTGLVENDGVVGVTSNPTIFQGAIAEGDAYDEQIRELIANESTTPRRSSGSSPSDDIRDACDVLRPVWDDGSGKDGWVSLEVDPNLAHDTEGTIVRGQAPARARRQAQPLRQDPRHERGPAGDRGDDRQRHPDQRHADLLARAPPRGGRGLRPRRSSASSTAAATRRHVASVASFFVSRVDTEADKRLDAIGGHDELKGKLAIANAKLAYQTYLEIFSGARVGGAGGQGRDAAALPVGLDLDQEPGLPRRRSTSRSSSAATRSTRCRARPSRPSRTTARSAATRSRRTSRAPARCSTSSRPAGVDYDDVVAMLEREGVEKFAQVLHGPDREASSASRSWWPRRWRHDADFAARARPAAARRLGPLLGRRRLRPSRRPRCRPPT